MRMTEPLDIASNAARIVAAYVSNNRVAAGELPGLFEAVHQALASLTDEAPVVDAARRPAVSIKRSVTDDYIICLEDGLKFKSLKRHLRSAYGLTPEHYRLKWGLPHDYPMAAPSYAARRSTLAKQIGLGRRRRHR
jgi:predicted transcriptional regulator